jgi:lipopolysaccharide export system permease protein
MKIIRGYLGRAVIGTSALVMAVLLALGGFIEFVGQLDDIGTGGYGVPEGLIYTLLKIPDMAFIMMPMTVLLGGLLGLGALANGSEMIALRASGVSLAAMARSLLVTGLGLALLGLVLGEYLSPPLERYSRQYRTFAMHGPSGVATGESAWVRDGSVIMNMSRLGDPSRFGGVYLFRLAPGNRLSGIARADSAGLDESKRWTLNNYAGSTFMEQGVVTRRERRSTEVGGLNPELLGLTVVRPEALDGVALWRYSRYLRENELDAHRYEVAFWSRVAAAFAIAPMCVLALPFAFGQMRRAGTSARMVIGVFIGLAYFLFSRGLADGSEVYNLNPVLVGWLPTILLGLATLMALARAR